MIIDNKVQAEKHKITIEYFKFLTTLSTGSLVLLTSFLGKLNTPLKFGFLVAVSVAGFLVCIIACVGNYTILVKNFGNPVEGKDLFNAVVGIVITRASFIVATTALAVFAVANL